MSPSSPRASQPVVAPVVPLALTWFLPGAGHFYMGRFRTGLIAFVVVEGLYALGLLLSGGMFLEYLPPEMQGAFAAVLSPEVGNLGALLFHVNHFGYGPGQPRVWPDTMDIGTTLTAASGVLNLFVMARAHLDARAPERDQERALDPPTAALATWLVPGLGQFLQGRKLRGLLVFVSLTGLFLIGCWLAAGSNLDRERHFYYWAGQSLLGSPAILAEFVHGHPRVTGEVPYADGGVVLACVAGMLNVLMMLDAFAWSEERQLGKPPKAATEPAPESVPEPGLASTSPEPEGAEA